MEDENYTAELLYAADKYELEDLVNIFTFTQRSELIENSDNNQVKMCARQFRSEVNPDTAADILLLADRHCLARLKQVGSTQTCQF